MGEISSCWEGESGVEARASTRRPRRAREAMFCRISAVVAGVRRTGSEEEREVMEVQGFEDAFHGALGEDVGGGGGGVLADYGRLLDRRVEGEFGELGPL